MIQNSMDNNKRTNNNFFQNPSNNRPLPPPPPPRASAGGISHGQGSSSYYSNAPQYSSTVQPPPPPPRPAAAAPKTYPTSYSSTPITTPFVSNAPAVQTQQPSSDWFDEGAQSAAPSNPSDWYSTTPQTTYQQPQQQAPMSMPQTFNPAQVQSSSLSGPMQSSNHSTYQPSSSPGYNPSEFEDEPPLLEELGVNIPHIIAKTRAVILPISRQTKDDQHLMDDTDLAGPLFFGLLLGGELLLSGKIHFGYIYGFGSFAWLGMSLILNLLSPPDAPISIWTVMSILGYSLLPVNILAFLNIFVRLKNVKLVGFILASVVILWCTTSCTRLFEKLGLRDQRYLIAYPAMLVYSAFVILTIF